MCHISPIVAAADKSILLTNQKQKVAVTAAGTAATLHTIKRSAHYNGQNRQKIAAVLSFFGQFKVVI